MDGQVIARLYPSPSRRVAGAGALAALGGTLVWLALAQPTGALGVGLFLLVCGVAVLVGAVRLWQATARGLELTATELREAGGGRVLARLAEVHSIARGALALKPSNGFLLVTAAPGPFVWAPGLWWRVGRRVGVGGVTTRHETRFMAEAIADRLERRG